MDTAPTRAGTEVSLCLDAVRAPLLARPYVADADPGPIVAALAQVPELMEVTLPFISAALGPSAVDWRSKEIVIGRTSALTGLRIRNKPQQIQPRRAVSPPAQTAPQPAQTTRRIRPATAPIDHRQHAVTTCGRPRLNATPPSQAE